MISFSSERLEEELIAAPALNVMVSVLFKPSISLQISISVLAIESKVVLTLCLSTVFKIKL